MPETETAMQTEEIAPAAKQTTQKTNKERLKEITDSIETSIRELFETDRYRSYLSVMIRFHKYSVNNTMLIYLQKPDATLVAGFNKWKDQFGRHVKKGEKGIQIIAPTPFLKKTQEPVLDPDTQAPMLDADGNAMYEEKTVKIPMFKPVSVFDVSQTEGRPLPYLTSTLSGDVQQYEAFMEALRRSSPVPVQMETIGAGTDGYFSAEQQRIAIREGMSQVQTVSAVIHEIAHSKLHNYSKTVATTSEADAKAPMKKDRHTEEVEAESISYAVCQYYGIETAENSFGYIATWSKGKELKELRASLETINQTASALISDIDRNYAEVCKERGIEIKPQEESRAEPEKTEVPQTEETISEVKAVSTPRELPERNPGDQPPDAVIHPQALEFFGYMEDGMFPVSKDRALELFARDVPIYLIYQDKTEGLVFEPEEILNHDGLYGVTKEDWETVKANIPCRDIEKRFSDSPGDAFLIYHLNDTERELMFRSFDDLAAPPSISQYHPVYVGELSVSGETGEKLEALFQTFNLQRPADYTFHSMSASDIVALKQNGVITYHYCDSVGFQPLPDFGKPENYLRNAEMAIEDDYGMIDGIINNGPKQPTVAELEAKVNAGEAISLLDLANAINAERSSKKPSVLDRLKRPVGEPKQAQKTERRRNGAEREI